MNYSKGLFASMISLAQFKSGINFRYYDELTADSYSLVNMSIEITVSSNKVSWTNSIKMTQST